MAFLQIFVYLATLSVCFSADIIAVKYYDIFNDDTYGMAHENGKLVVECTCQGNENVKMVNVETSASVGNTDCSNAQATFRFILTTKFKFGAYACVAESGTSRSTFDHDIMTCSDDNPYCVYGGECDHLDNRFCYYDSTTQDQPRMCAELYLPPGSTCSSKENVKFTFCDNKLETLRESYACYNSTSNVGVWSKSNSHCQTGVKDRGTTYLSYDDNKTDLRYYDAVPMTRGNNLLFSVWCDRLNIPIQCQLINMDGEVVINNITGESITDRWKPSTICTDHFRFKLSDDIFDNGTQILKLKCTLQTMDEFYHEARLAVMESSLVVTELHRPDGMYLKCTTDKKLPPGFTMMDWFWFNLESKNDLPVGQILKVSKSGTYRCYGTLQYRTCSPYKHYSMPIESSNSLKVDARSVHEREEEELQKRLDEASERIYVAFGVLATVMLIIIGLDIYIYMKDKYSLQTVDVVDSQINLPPAEPSKKKHSPTSSSEVETKSSLKAKPKSNKKKRNKKEDSS